MDYTLDLFAFNLSPSHMRSWLDGSRSRKKRSQILQKFDLRPFDIAFSFNNVEIDVHFCRLISLAPTRNHSCVRAIQPELIFYPQNRLQLKRDFTRELTNETSPRASARYLHQHMKMISDVCVLIDLNAILPRAPVYRRIHQSKSLRQPHAALHRSQRQQYRKL